jgi:hypothetical protein
MCCSLPAHFFLAILFYGVGSGHPARPAAREFAKRRDFLLLAAARRRRVRPCTWAISPTHQFITFRDSKRRSVVGFASTFFAAFRLGPASLRGVRAAVVDGWRR